MICLNCILLALILGLSIVTITFIPVFEDFLLYIVIFWPSHFRLRDLVKKNLNSHRRRNSKTARMLLVAVAVIVTSS